MAKGHDVERSAEASKDSMVVMSEKDSCDLRRHMRAGRREPINVKQMTSSLNNEVRLVMRDCLDESGFYCTLDRNENGGPHIFPDGTFVMGISGFRPGRGDLLVGVHRDFLAESKFSRVCVIGQLPARNNITRGFDLMPFSRILVADREIIAGYLAERIGKSEFNPADFAGWMQSGLRGSRGSVEGEYAGVLEQVLSYRELLQDCVRESKSVKEVFRDGDYLRSLKKTLREFLTYNFADWTPERFVRRVEENMIAT